MNPVKERFATMEEYGQIQTQKTQQKLSPQQLQLLNLLSQPVEQLEETVKRELEGNPMIDISTFSNDSAAPSPQEQPKGNLSDEYDPDAEGDDSGDDYSGNDNKYREHLPYNNEQDYREPQIPAPTSVQAIVLQSID